MITNSKFFKKKKFVNLSDIFKIIKTEPIYKNKKIYYIKDLKNAKKKRDFFYKFY